MVFLQISELFRNNINIFALIGASCSLYLTLKTFFCIWHYFKLYFLSSKLGLNVNLKSFGSWAAITGATDGIGKAYAEELARLGLNIVLISRSIEKLNAVAKSITDAYPGIKTKCLQIDFSEVDSIYPIIAKELEGLEIGTLVNNVGISYDSPLFLTECSDQDLKQLVNVNCFSVMFMTKIVLPQMVKRKKGAIINISSLSAWAACPLLSVYSATKAFIHLFSNGIAAEYKKDGIIIQSVSPGYVTTKLSKIKSTSFFAPGPKEFAESALNTVGLESDTCGYFAHALQLCFTLMVPSEIINKITLSMLNGIRKKKLAKDNKPFKSE